VYRHDTGKIHKGVCKIFSAIHTETYSKKPQSKSCEVTMQVENRTDNPVILPPPRLGGMLAFMTDGNSRVFKSTFLP